MKSGGPKTLKAAQYLSSLKPTKCVAMANPKDENKTPQRSEESRGVPSPMLTQSGNLNTAGQIGYWLLNLERMPFLGVQE
jgi:hypothetical protein